MTAFRRNKSAGGVSEEAERGCGPDPWNLCRSSYRREAELIRSPLPACTACRIAVFGRKPKTTGGEENEKRIPESIGAGMHDRDTVDRMRGSGGNDTGNEPVTWVAA